MYISASLTHGNDCPTMPAIGKATDILKVQATFNRVLWQIMNSTEMYLPTTITKSKLALLSLFLLIPSLSSLYKYMYSLLNPCVFIIFILVLPNSCCGRGIRNLRRSRQGKMTKAHHTLRLPYGEEPGQSKGDD